MRHPFVSSLPLCVLAIALGACGGPAPSSSPGGSTTTTAAPSVNGRELDPIEVFLGLGDSGRPSEEDLAKERQAEEFIQSCMQAEGFTYIPRDPAASAGGPTDGPWSLPPAEFAATYGYGITTITTDNGSQLNDDPNAAAVEAMSITEQRAYYHALYGDFVTVDDNGNLTKRPPEEGTTPTTSGDKSCSQQADEAVFGVRAESDPSADASADNPFSALEGEMQAMGDRIRADQRLFDATKKWSDCMADAGYPSYSDIKDAIKDVDTRSSELLGPNLEDAADPQALTDLRAFEIAVATADFSCRGDYDSVRKTVTDEVQNAFINDHRAELEQYRDAIAAGTANFGKGGKG